MKFQEIVSKLGPKREDTLDSVKKVTGIINELRPLTSASSGEPQSTLALLLEHGPRILEPIFNTIKEFAEAKKMEMKLRIDQFYGNNQPQIAPGMQRTGLPGPGQIHPFSAKLIEVVNKNDESYFDMMRQQITRYYGQHVTDGLTDGSLTSDLVIETLHGEIGMPLLPNLKSYIDRFIKYLQTGVVEPASDLLAECQTCHAQYDFAKEEWEKDDKVCEDCRGTLKLVEREGKA